jgi:hypothetical protein
MSTTEDAEDTEVQSCAIRHPTRLIAAACVLLTAATATAQVPEKSCDAFLLPPRQVRGKAVGPTSCLLQETSAYEGRALTRLDVGLDGTVDGYLARVGNYKEYFSNSPDLVFPQTWGPRDIFFGVAAYERAQGASMTIVIPRDASAWNGKMWVTAHGRGASFKQGQLKAWNRYANAAEERGAHARQVRRLRAARGGTAARRGILLRQDRCVVRGAGEDRRAAAQSEVVSG